MAVGILRGTQGVADGDIRNTGDGHDRADGGFLYFHFIQPVEFVQLADAYLLQTVRVVFIYHGGVHAYPDHAVFHFPDPDTSHILIVVDGADQHLGVCFRIAFRRRDVFQYGLKERLHIPLFISQIQNGNPGLGRSVDEGAVQLFF